MNGLRYKRVWRLWFLRLAVLIVPGLLFLGVNQLARFFDFVSRKLERGIERVADRLPDPFVLVEVEHAATEEDDTWKHGV